MRPLPLLYAAADSDYTGRLVVSTKTVAAKRSARKSSARAGDQSIWTERNVRGIRILQAPALTKLPWLVQGFSTKPGGVSDHNGERLLNLGFTDRDTKEEPGTVRGGGIALARFGGWGVEKMDDIGMDLLE